QLRPSPDALLRVSLSRRKRPQQGQHVAHGPLETDERSAGNDVVADIQFDNRRNSGDCSYVPVCQTMAGQNQHILRMSKVSGLAQAVQSFDAFFSLTIR